MNRNLIYVFGAGICLATSPSSATTDLPLDHEQQAAALASYEQRLKCAAYYRLSFEIAHARQPGARRTELLKTYDFVGKNMLLQASAMAEPAGRDVKNLRDRFSRHLQLLRAQTFGEPGVYNAISAKMHPICRQLIVH